MGRLTLNVLLSFAQFEREVTAERIRDKIAASKKKGLWMGGVPPLGYDPHPDPNARELVVNKDEARTVQTLFDLYDRHGSLAAVEREAAELGLRSKRHRFRSGREQGGNRMSGGQIHKILLNPVYLGQIRHKDKIWPGKHPAIIDEALWDRVQQKLQQAARRGRGRTIGASDPALLTGKLCDDTGDRLTPTHSIKSGRRHRYYVSNRLISGGPDPTGWRLPARALEKSIADLIAAHLGMAADEHRLLATPDLRGNGSVHDTAAELVEHLGKPEPDLLRVLLASGTVTAQKIHLTLDKVEVATRLGVPVDDLAANLCDIHAPLRLRRRGVEAKLV
ncbi:recombinase family protein, partial [Roseobacter sp.]|uniref:recombinase family protein n=1 Tax=Roseobacter sp. TaxID=1907202 RepID=UPI0025DFAB3D